MKIDAELSTDIAQTISDAHAFEELGFDGLWMGEAQHDPLLMALQASQNTSKLSIGTGVAIAFARNPMSLAYSAYDLAQYSKGRFILGLGSQIKAHIERRFSMPWSNPAQRMREYVEALRAIWASWDNGERLRFEGSFYNHTLMTPFFSPAPHEYGPPPVFIAGVGMHMTKVAGEVADGFLFHPFTTEQYIREVTVPALIEGRARTGKNDLEGFTLSGPSFVCIGSDDEELELSIKEVKERIAFYASTPLYRGVLDLHGWGELQPELTRMSKDGKWAEMGNLITDDILKSFAVIGDPTAVGKGLKARWGDLVSRISIYPTLDPHSKLWPELMASLTSN